MTDMFDKPLGGEGEGWAPGRKRETVVQTKSYRHDNFEVTDELLVDAGDQIRDLEVARRFAAQMRAEIADLRAQLATARADALREAADWLDRLAADEVAYDAQERDLLRSQARSILALIDKEPSNDGS